MFPLATPMACDGAAVVGAVCLHLPMTPLLAAAAAARGKQ